MMYGAAADIDFSYQDWDNMDLVSELRTNVYDFCHDNDDDIPPSNVWN